MISPGARLLPTSIPFRFLAAALLFHLLGWTAMAASAPILAALPAVWPCRLISWLVQPAVAVLGWAEGWMTSDLWLLRLGGSAVALALLVFVVGLSGSARLRPRRYSMACSTWRVQLTTCRDELPRISVMPMPARPVVQMLTNTVSAAPDWRTTACHSPGPQDRNSRKPLVLTS